MKMGLFVSNTAFLILIWLSWNTAQGYNYNPPQPYYGKSTEPHLKFYPHLVSNAQHVTQNSQQSAIPPGGSQLEQPTLHQPQFHQSLQKPFTYSSTSNTAQTNSAVYSVNRNTNLMFTNSKQLTEKPGDYVSQSEASELHQYPYPYKQKYIDDNKAFTRYITTCYQNGRCDSLTLGAGAIDPNNQHTLQSLRASVQYGSTACSKGLQTNAQTNLRPNILDPARNQDKIVGQPSLTALPQQHPGYPRSNNFGNLNQASQIVSLQAAPQTRPTERRLYPYTEVLKPNSFN